MTARTITIYDPDGEAYDLDWYDRFDDGDVWCQFCEHGITNGWAVSLGAGGLFVLCNDCAKANATTEDR